ncbi:hypothetical protein G7048_23735 [Diaphorobacter sp. HDW4B]|uniref:hypothetical protein n=1 Tax=Diaphorobacter sp. HDW4B TaxID=2714925 RepID=UPI00140C60CD|nr:hypothetical protein [Diaphorobacter sp. HDW4B]QIL73099.1 hypothetical protein G7048_23735 [Diaphorobacter sp. HDW4B]
MSKSELTTYVIDGLKFKAKDCVRGVLINPVLPRNFDNTPNELRPASHRKWWYRPFINVDTIEEMDEFYASRADEYAEKGRQSWEEGRPRWLQAWPNGARYVVRCLNGGAWDRSCWLGAYVSLEAALDSLGVAKPS